MHSRRIVSVSAAVMLGLSTAVVPVITPNITTLSVAAAQTQADPLPQPTVRTDGVDWNLARYTDGRIVALATSQFIVGSQTEGTPTYDFEDTTYDMRLVAATDNTGAPILAGTEQVYYWETVPYEGNHSTEWVYEWGISSVRDTELVRSPRNGRLVRPTADDQTAYLASNVEPFGVTINRNPAIRWRIPHLVGEPLFNVQLTMVFPRELPEPTLITPGDTYFYGGSIPLEASTADPKERAQFPAFNTNGARGPIPAEYIEWEVLPTEDPYVQTMFIPYMPAGTMSIINWQQMNPERLTYTALDATVTADKFHYEPIEVYQAEEETGAAPLNPEADRTQLAGVNFTATDETPEWVEVNLETGALTARPGYGVPAGTYEFPVDVTWPEASNTGTRILGTVIVKDRPVVANYTPVTVVQGDTLEVTGPDNSGFFPPDTVFTPIEGVTPDWVTVNPDGSVTVNPGSDVAPGPQPVRIAIELPDGTTGEGTLVVYVVNPNQPVYEPIQVVQGGDSVSTQIPANQDGTELPEGTRFGSTPDTPEWATVNPDGTVSVEVGYDVPVGAVNVPVLVTYPDGTTSVVNAPVSIINDDDPRYAPTTVQQGSDAVTPAPVDTTDGTLPEETTFTLGEGAPDWVTGIDSDTGVLTLEPGLEIPAQEYEIPVIVMIPNGDAPGSTTINIIAPVFVTEAVKSPVYEPITVAQGDTGTVPVPTAYDGVTQLPVGTTFAAVPSDPANPEAPATQDWVTIQPDGSISVVPGNGTPAGTYQVPVEVSYPDGTSEIVNATVTVTNPNEPAYTAETVLPGEIATSDVPSGLVTDGATFEVIQENVPAGWTNVSVDADGVVTATSPAEAEPGSTINIPVTINYADGTSVVVDFPVIIAPHTDAVDPFYNPVTTPAGVEVDSPLSLPEEQSIPEDTGFALEEGWTAPEGWTVSVDLNMGVVTTTPPTDARPGDSISVPVVATYPDGSTDTIPAIITVGVDQAADNNPSYDSETTAPGTAVDLPQIGDTDLPEGTEFGLPEDYTPPTGWDVVVDPGTGVVTVTPPADAVPGQFITVPVLVTYPDGSTDNAPATVIIGGGEAGEHQPEYQPENTQAGVPVDVTQDASLPAGSEFATPEGYVPPAGWDVVVDPATGTVTVTPPATASPGDVIQVPVVVTYPDGTVDRVTATVVVDADELFWFGTQVEQGGVATITVPRNLDPDGLPEDVTYTLGDGAPEWATLNPDGTITVTPGEDVLPGYYTIPVEITDADGNVRILPAIVEVVEKEQEVPPVPGGSDGGSSDGSDGGSSGPGSSLPGSSSGSSGSSVTDRCVQAAATVGIPLLALLPIGLATQVNIPGLSPLVADAQSQLQNFNTDLQQQAGIHDPATANFMNQVNAELQKHGGVVGKAVGAAALIAIGGLVGKYLYDNCVPRR
ncbi:MAG: Rib/alpha-like domain-containing protein [Corynebacterium sp.]|uniref:Rib/alpha-like domain-containing protein n=1 Tax=Corynebacterium sp. TaxID=1720 RepID=UPI0026E01475|nr:Rib/alpha-like domain-containing protein [Corynebacterium sp.]MDO5668471.1 Rib/alpha-like domain-containing protein [Corynebacterium sp.]